ncbi:GNAT family N-acetyltransferase [Streptomyces odontomachi]|uniref:GNAT family N-acetyltransferase n=1 Tax=Streptomyces odontomachi TaxID=2944940 RepID=UPI00210E52C6|nr:GNAT family N-acetyltransferase [Streptomyces sp. ODS25]
MTTTLRPSEPLQRSEDGGSSRRYEVCVNGRPVGAVHLATHRDFGPSVAVVEELHIEPADRGRGRGAVAALAAEEVARAWGCTRLQAPVPAGSDHALRLATALGYVERSRAMDKLIGALVPLPQGSASRPMTQAEFESWRAVGREDYARSWIESGVPAAEAYTKADRDYARSLPQGRTTKDHVLHVLEHDDVAVGTLWLGLRKADAWVMSVDVAEEHRSKGHGRTLMHLAERNAEEAGRDRIGLHVFSRNTTALRLYASLDYRPIIHHMSKTLV